MTKTIKGTISAWKDKKGFGFIKLEEEGDDIFIHITEIKNISRRPYIGDIIFFQIQYDQDGRPKGVNAKIKGMKAEGQQNTGILFRWGQIILLAILLATGWFLIKGYV